MIAGFEAKDKAHPPPKDPICLSPAVPASPAGRITWRRRFPEYPVLNRGFGGSTTPEVNYYFDRVIAAYKPKVIVFFCGSNDMASKRTPQQAIEDFGTFVKMTQEKLPGTKIVYISQHLPASRAAAEGGVLRGQPRRPRRAATKDSIIRF